MKNFNLDKEYIDENDLNYILNHSQLWHLREILVGLLKILERKMSKHLCNEEYMDIHKRMYYLSNNLEIIEDVMVQKESIIFDITEYGEICFN